MALITTTTLQILKFNQAQKMYKAGSTWSGFLFARIMTAQNAKKALIRQPTDRNNPGYPADNIHTMKQADPLYSYTVKHVFGGFWCQIQPHFVINVTSA